MTELCILTGASRGIGLATARLFLSRGARVVNISRSPCALAGVSHLTADLAVPGFEAALDAPLRAALSDPTHATRVVLVHNAAFLESDSVSTVSAEVLRRTLAVGLEAPAALNRLLLPEMPRGSAIVYVGSTLSEKAVAGAFSYVVSKHATVGMMRATCQDLLGRGIHTACVCPGVTDTEMLRQHAGGSAEVLDVLRSMTGEGRLIEPDEIARVIAAVADNPVLNGAILHANLGQRER